MRPIGTFALSHERWPTNLNLPTPGVQFVALKLDFKALFVENTQHIHVREFAELMALDVLIHSKF